MMSTYKHPPTFEKKDYCQWKKEVELWQMLTEMDKTKQGVALALSLEGKAREIAIAIDKSLLTTDDGVKNVLTELDKLFEKEKTYQMYEAYTKFENLRKTEAMSMLDYIVEFEQLNKKCTNLKIDTDALLALKLLYNANLSEQQRQLALTACPQMKYETMKNVLTRIFTNNKTDLQMNSEVEIKEEALIAENDGRRRESVRSSMYRGARFRGYNRRTIGRGTGRMNPVFNGVVSRCNVCQSTHHWAKDCPHANKNVNMTENVEKHSEETVHMTLMTEAKLLDKISNQDVLVMEACNTAIVDTACTKTVCGKEWLQYMLDSLSSEELKSVEIKKSHMPFKFGDGRIINSYQTVTFPAKVGNRLCNIKTEVVECKIPLLLSKESLAKAEVVIDIGKDHVMMFGQKVNIQTTSTGHYCVNIMRNDKERTDDENVVLVIDNNMEMFLHLVF